VIGYRRRSKGSDKCPLQSALPKRNQARQDLVDFLSERHALDIDLFYTNRDLKRKDAGRQSHVPDYGRVR
jgi:hypothetical protein